MSKISLRPIKMAPENLLVMGEAYLSGIEWDWDLLTEQIEKDWSLAAECVSKDASSGTFLLGGSKVTVKYLNRRSGSFHLYLRYSPWKEASEALQWHSSMISIAAFPCSVSSRENAHTALKVIASAARLPQTVAVMSAGQLFSPRSFRETIDRIKKQPETDLLDFVIWCIIDVYDNKTIATTLSMKQFGFRDLFISDIGRLNRYRVKKQLQTAARMVIYRKRPFADGERIALCNTIFQAKYAEIGIKTYDFQDDIVVHLIPVGEIIPSIRERYF